MWRSKGEREQMAVLAVLAAAAREAEELLAQESDDLTPEVTDEANRRLKSFMAAAREVAR